MTYAFTFDASACSGCKACQAACKDKNQLPVGVLWRRVYEVNGGGWEKRGAAWTNTVFAYNLSIACNHCEHPKCAGVCPTDAFVVRADGIVYIDSSKCMGCGYCAWACPYSAPQYNHEIGRMTKCNFCFDEIDKGNPPACVAACPLRALNYVDIDGGWRTADGGQSSSAYRPLWKIPASEHPFPMYPRSRTQPHIAIKPHAAMKLETQKRLANVEEIRPKKESAWSEFPLVVFTLLAQLSVGAFWLAALFLPKPLDVLPLLAIGAALALGMAASFAHLGTKRNAWRAIFHLKKSWLSREILFALFFGTGWLAATGESLLFGRSSSPLLWLTALAGFALIFSMGMAYRLRARPAWDTWKTNAAFFISAALLGTTSMAAFLPVSFPWRYIAAALILAQWAATRQYSPKDGFARAARIALSLISALAAVLPFFPPAPLFSLVLFGEAAGRWLFYNNRD